VQVARIEPISSHVASAVGAELSGNGDGDGGDGEGGGFVTRRKRGRRCHDWARPKADRPTSLQSAALVGSAWAGVSPSFSRAFNLNLVMLLSCHRLLFSPFLQDGLCNDLQSP
jgi:hypothetical protein